MNGDQENYVIDNINAVVFATYATLLKMTDDFGS